MRRIAALALAVTLPACAQFWRVVDDPSRTCPPGHKLAWDKHNDRSARLTCVPRVDPPCPETHIAHACWTGETFCLEHQPNLMPVDDPRMPCPPGQRYRPGRALGADKGDWFCTPCPEPPAPTRTPAVIETPAPRPTPDGTPAATPTPSPAPVQTATPTPAVTPTASVPPTPTPQGICRLPGPPWLRGVPAEPVPVHGRGACAGCSFVGPGHNGLGGHAVNWACAAGEQGRSPAQSYDVTLGNGHEVIDPATGYLNDRHLQRDAYTRHVKDGRIIPTMDGDVEVKPWDGWACDPPLCEATPIPTVGPTPTPAPTAAPGDCRAVESTPHWMAPGNKCHAWRMDGGEVRCLVDSTIRPICDTDHGENWDTFCGRRTHDPDFSRPEGSMEWFISGADDLGPSDENSAQRWIRGAPGAEVSVTVCIPANKRTPDGCLIIRRGDGCGSRVFNLPEGE